MIIEGGKRWKPKEVSIYEFFRGMILILFLGIVEYKTQVRHRKIFLLLIQDRSAFIE